MCKKTTILRQDIVVRFVDIDVIVDYHGINSIFISIIVVIVSSFPYYIMKKYRTMT
jgi:hypothetical protein